MIDNTTTCNEEFAHVLEQLKEEYEYALKDALSSDPISTALHTVWAQRVYERIAANQKSRMCATCSWHEYNPKSSMYICNNDDAPDYQETTADTYSCDFWEDENEGMLR